VVFAFTIGLYVYIEAVKANPYNWFGEMPSLKEIENPENDLSSEVISSDGVSLGRYFLYNRSAVPYDNLSPALIKTLLISEDHRFYNHSGLDAEAFLRVIFGLVTFSKQGGGSTLTQQTAKNLFRTREDELEGSLAKLSTPLAVLISKTKEWIIAVELEKNFTKEEIIALYLNTVSFNNNAFGIKVASETYFGKDPQHLNVQESALLVGMLQGLSLFNPVTHPERATIKRNQVIDKLFDHGMIASLAARDSIKGLPLQLQFTVQDHNEGLAPYFRTMLRQELNKWCRARGLNLNESGLKIYTTIDSRVQAFAERAMQDHMRTLQNQFDKGWGNRDPWVNGNGDAIADFMIRKIKSTPSYRSLKVRYGDKSDSVMIRLNEKKRMRVFTWSGDRDTLMSSIDSIRHYNRFLQTGLLAMHPLTGEVKAWVGGINHRYFQYDHVRQSTRQAGSTFKPFVYALAMENGYSPCQTFYDKSPTINDNGHLYQVRNSGGGYGDGEQYTLRQALAKSLNTITVQLTEKLTPQNVAAFAKKIGISTDIAPVYSIGLGTNDVTLYDMVAAYAAFANLGTYIKPHYITRIEDKNGNVLEQFIPVPKQVLDENTAYKTLHLLRGGVEEPVGTSHNIDARIKVDNEVGGKTGTTDDGSDGWYIGVTQNLVTGIWVGGEERTIHFPHWGESSGGRTALPIWEKFMLKIYEHPEINISKGTFQRPANLDMTLDCDQIPIDSTYTF
jgi:penicillin-binding protein 1A